jgi:hypothetical protein
MVYTIMRMFDGLMCWLVEMWRLAGLVWAYRSYKHCHVSSYARTALAASKLVDELRKRYPGRNFVWSLSVNHTFNTDCSYICMWEGGVVGSLSFVFHGPLDDMISRVSEGYFDPKFSPRKDAP